MCGRYQFSQEMDTPAMRRLRYLAEASGQRLPEGEVAPGCEAPVLVDGAARAQLRLMQWGFPLGERLVFNARAETAGTKRSFADCLRQRRCVIPTTGFYEWSRDRQQYHFTGREGGLLYLAGLYDTFDGAPRFVVLTCPAVGQVASIHHRQPVALAQEELLLWLRGEPEPLLHRAGMALRGTPVIA